jgi:succinate dehydrogenase / fumarate reductase membrane anchor subunit
MVNNITSLTGNGLKDWLIQRLTAVYFGLYCFFLLGYCIVRSPLHASVWQALFANPGMKIASIIALLALVLHAWIGIWTVTTDYLKCTALRLSIQLLVAAGLLAEFIWGIGIFWR